jgi:hypothetical protein
MAVFPEKRMRLAYDPDTGSTLVAMMLVWLGTPGGQLNVALFEGLEQGNTPDQWPEIVRLLLRKHGLPPRSDFLKITLYCISSRGVEGPNGDPPQIVSISRILRRSSRYPRRSS